MTANPHHVRIAARLAEYPNTEEERANIARVDNEVFDRVREYEQYGISEAARFMESADAVLEEATSLAVELKELRNQARSSGGVSGDLALRYEDLRRQADDLLGQLDRNRAEAEWHEEKCADPYQSYIDLTEKWTQLRPVIAL